MLQSSKNKINVSVKVTYSMTFTYRMTVTYRVKMVYYKTVVYQEAGNLHPVWFNNLDIFRHIEELLAQTKKKR